MTFSKQFLIDEEGETIENKITGKGRWAIHYRRVFKHEDKFYATTYSIGATESQDIQPYEDDDVEIECPEVFPKYRMMVVYET